jgi:hypothetical protein
LLLAAHGFAIKRRVDEGNAVVGAEFLRGIAENGSERRAEVGKYPGGIMLAR